MLLQHRLNEINTIISGYQQQIDELNAKISALQAHAQKVGSVEAAMESAVQQVQTAIAMINNVCADEMAEFQNVINSCFDSQPIAELPAAPEPEPSPEPESPAPVEPEPEKPEPEEDDNGTIDLVPDDTAQKLEPMILVMNGEDETNGNGKNKHPWSELNWREFVKYAAKLGVNTKSRKRGEIEADLLDIAPTTYTGMWIPGNQ